MIKLLKKTLTTISLVLAIGIFIPSIITTAYAESNPIFDKYQQGGIGAAESEYNKLIKNNTKDDVLYANMVYIYIKENQHQKALNTCIEGIKLIPNSYMLYNMLGTLYKAEGNVDAAIKAFNKSIEIEPTEAPYYNRGSLNARTGQFDKAISDFTMAIKYSPINPDAYKERAIAKIGKATSSRNMSAEMSKSMYKSMYEDLDMALKQYRETNNIEGYQEVLGIMENLNKINNKTK